DKVQFGDVTAIANRTLTINKEELISLLKEDSAFTKVDIELAAPGDSCRIVQVADVIQPRVKIAGSGQVFPGVLSPMEQVGSGKTISLRGVTVLESWQYPEKVHSILDMTGPVASLSPLSRFHQVVLMAQPRHDISVLEYARSLKKASLKVAKFLAEAAINVKPDDIKVYDLNEQDAKGLPKVAYVCQFYSIKEVAEPLVYGNNAKNMLPTIMHPNEFIDGAVINNEYEYMRITEVTYSFQNHPVINELYSRHGKDLNFVGVILKDSPMAIDDKRRSALMTAKLAHSFLDVDGIVITKEGGGHPQLDMSLTADACATYGIETVIMMIEFLSKDSKSHDVTLFNSKAANAVISCGRTDFIDIPKLDKVIGMRLTDDPNSPVYSVFYNGGTISCQSSRGLLSQFGENNLTAVVY
ncbi:MAG: glycine/sarcosine/betaine reductase component B subunit, partial [Firmicutes bacterium]|nr:glycine/sarcosine/betaine reductase component B subunit [Bacillota bacterium]